MTDLTPRQKETLREIQSHFAVLKRPPTYRELSARLGHIFTNAVNDLLNALERKGAIKRDPKSRSRGIQLVTDNCPYCCRPLPGARVSQ